MSATNIQSSRCETLPFMPTDVRELFLDILNVQSCGDNEKRMVLFITDYLRGMKIPFEIDKVGNILVKKGNAKTYPCLVSHMDTVHDIVDCYDVVTEVIQGREIAYAMSGEKETGVGGDNKVGVLSCLWMLSQAKNIKVVFFTQEETGMAGSNKISREWLEDCGYIIQLDRWGKSDFISINGGQKTVSDEFLQKAAPLMSEYCYKEAEGLITDSINLWNDSIGVSCINLSCGYYQHHTAKEKVDLNETWNALCFTRALILSLGEKKYPSLPTYKAYKGVYSKYWKEESVWKDYPKSKGFTWSEYDEPIQAPQRYDECCEEDVYILEELAKVFIIDYTEMTKDPFHKHYTWLLEEFNRYREEWGYESVSRMYLENLIEDYVFTMEYPEEKEDTL